MKTPGLGRKQSNGEELWVPEKGKLSHYVMSDEREFRRDFALYLP